ncbi:GNAT family N-acetyltransferase [Anoxybacterium hadale]
MEIRKIEQAGILEPMDLVWQVFQEFEAPDYAPEGIATFKSFIDSQCSQLTLELFGAYAGEQLLGVIATRNNGSHISLFFVRKEYHGQGIGKSLFGHIRSSYDHPTITVNSSPYAAEVYRKLGFTDLDSEQVTDGLRYIPMEYHAKAQQAMNQLRKNNMAGYYVHDSKQLLQLLAELIPPGSTVGSGDSVTLEQTGVFQFLRSGNYNFLDKFVPSLTREEKRQIYLKNFTADTFITGTSAVTLDGKLFNIDGNGSRVAPMLYGPEQVIVVAGVNKLTDNVEAAIHRTRQIAAPLDALRLGKETPCVKLGHCIDCNHKQRICNDFVLIAGQFSKDRIKVIIVNEALGY